MNATQRGSKAVVVGILLALVVGALALAALPESAVAQTGAPPARVQRPPLRATPVTPDMACVHLTTDGAPSASFVGGQIKERCFAFPGEAGAAVSIVLKPATAGAVPVMELRGPSGEVVARSKDGKIADQTLNATGPYALIVSGADLPKAIRVEASVVAAGGTGLGQPALPGPGVATEPATLCSGKIKIGQTQAGMVPFPGETCRFTFAAKRGESVGVTMSSLTGGLQPELTLVAPDGSVLDTGHSVDARTRYASSLRLPASGAYTVLAGSIGGQTAGAFTLSLTPVQSAQCGDVVARGMLTEVLLPGAGNRCDLLWDMLDSSLLSVQIDPLDGAASPAWVALDPQGAVVASSADESAVWYAEAIGRYTLSISPASRRPERILVQIGPQFRYVYYSLPTCGGYLRYNTFTSDQPEVLSLPGSSCLFTFSGAAGDVIWVTAPKVTDESDFEPVAVLMAPHYAVNDPPEAVSGDNGTPDLALIRQHTLAKTGLYTIRISDYGNDDAGSFYIGLWKR